MSPSMRGFFNPETKHAPIFDTEPKKIAHMRSLPQSVVPIPEFK